jgi:hypothetical protein
MRFVAIKTIEQQATSELRTRAATVSYAACDREIYQMKNHGRHTARKEGSTLPVIFRPITGFC